MADAGRDEDRGKEVRAHLVRVLVGADDNEDFGLRRVGDADPFGLLVGEDDFVVGEELEGVRHRQRQVLLRSLLEPLEGAVLLPREEGEAGAADADHPLREIEHGVARNLELPEAAAVDGHRQVLPRRLV